VGSTGGITLSVGAAVYVPGEALTDMIERADMALYLAKQNGRNRVVSEDEVADQKMVGIK